MKFFVIYIFGIFQGIQCLYFKQDRYKFCSSIAGQLLVDDNLCDSNTLKYSVSNDALSIDSTGLVSITQVNKDLINIQVEVTCLERGKKSKALAVVDIISNCDLNALTNDQERDNILCFDKTIKTFIIAENIGLSLLGKLSVFSGISTKYTRDYFLLNSNQSDSSLVTNYFKINPTTSALTLTSPLDYESKREWNLKVVCQWADQHKTRNVTANIKVIVTDQNDNVPIFQKDKVQIKSIIVTDEKVIDETVFDRDIGNCSYFDVEVFGDPLGICHAGPLSGWAVEGVGTICRLMVDITKPKVPFPEEYTCNVAVIDVGYLLQTNETVSDRAILELQWVKDPNKNQPETRSRIQLRVNKNARNLTQVYKFPENKNKTHYVMHVPKHGFEITQDGIVYVDNVDRLRQSGVGIKTVVSSLPDNVQTELFISVIGEYRPINNDNPCNQTCSRFSSRRSCTANCGLGAVEGQCLWRSGSGGGGIVSNYATCTPNHKTCPNQICDSLEQAYPLLCPQDCTTKKIVGTGKLNSQTKTGIEKGTSPCWCNYNAECYCWDSTFRTTTTPYALQYEKPDTDNTSTKDRNQTINGVRVNSVLDNKLNHSNKSMCNTDCKITIATICGCVCLLGLLFILVWKTRRFKCQKDKTLKHVGSVASMSVIPSDYFDDRDYRTSHSSPQYGPYYKDSYNSSVTPEDAKWEFERENLQLDNTLGEGEFGKVVKAKAFNLDGKQNYTEVAVKMLKNCASCVEQQALWSEFNLLKDVQHPNVIRLLGACTQNGPVYIIVEFCEHGSLLSYLRNSRLEENGYVNQRYKPSKLSQQREPPELLTIRDLLSFAWQTAKGMKYLSEIKLVHRDLAARNILVGSGKVLKISDFGLTRDVYEADTYLKQSKGRIPVKWLAPESLYAQIYTTQSDVWSFGIVLWEIVTLGAPPYPGVPPERLYNLLLAGYRMDRPENCSDELYAVMQKCWKTDPQDRPTFSKLADIFDKMLQQRTEYLELTGGFEEDNLDIFGNLSAPSVSGISILGGRPLPIHSEHTPVDNRNSCSSYLTPALTNPIDSNTCLSDMTSLKREPSDSSEMASLLTETRGKNPFVNEALVTSRAEQTVV